MSRRPTIRQQLSIRTFNWGRARRAHIGAAFFSKSKIRFPRPRREFKHVYHSTNAGGEVFTDVVDYKIYITAPDSALTDCRQKQSQRFVQIMMFDKNYDRLLNGFDCYSVRNGRAQRYRGEIRFESEPVQMTDDMYILSGPADWDSFFTRQFCRRRRSKRSR